MTNSRSRSTFTLDRARQVLDLQDGVISRAQLTAVGAKEHDIRRLIRQRHLTVLHPGVLINHTGAPSWQQRAWAAVLYAWPAALAGQSALRAENGPGWRGCAETDPIEVAISQSRRAVAPPGVRIRRVTQFDTRVRLDKHPPRVRVEEATLDAAIAATDDFATIEVLAAAVRSRLTTATRLQEALEERDRVPARDWMLALLLDIAKGTQSVLEHGYLSYVERAHGLPHSVRQLRARGSRGAVYRDVSYVEYDTHLELDGRLDHDTVAGKDADLDRDLDAAVSGARTARLGWGQVYRRPCVTAAKVARILRAQGWAGRPHACGPGCTITQQFAA
ncbi:MAG: hypothetical protein V9G04_03625 [Nocardioides sp.]|jgi:hypothetical protein